MRQTRYRRIQIHQIRGYQGAPMKRCVVLFLYQIDCIKLTTAM